jgi:hypothetical protein
LCRFLGECTAVGRRKIKRIYVDLLRGKKGGS